MTFHELQGLWYYFLSIEKDLNETSRYIEPNGQENAYSFEFCKIIVLSCTEIENAFKQLCSCINPSKLCGNIGEYKGNILERYPKIVDALVIVPRWNAKNIYPFREWQNGKLSWWDAYTALKHHRVLSFKQATYKNAVYALAGLYILILYLYKMNSYDCKADESAYFESDYYPVPRYSNCPSELPDFIT